MLDGITHGIVSPIAGRLGEVSGNCFMLNVNTGAKANPARTGRPDFHSQDMCLHQGQVYCVHIEPDKTLLTAAFGGSATQRRGPYVHAWNGTTWTLVGGTTLDPGADSVLIAAGQRYNPQRCRIASDGTDLFVAWYDWVWDGDPSSSGKSYIRIAHLSGGSFTEVASEPIQGGGDGAFGGSVISLTVHAGVAYAVYSTNNFRDPRIFRSDGTGDFVDGFTPVGWTESGSDGPGDGTYVAVTTTAGRPVGIASKNIGNTIGSLITFDLTDGSVIREDPTPLGPSPLVPYGTNLQGFNILLLGGDAVAGYGPDHDQIAFILQGSPHGILVMPEDFSSAPAAIDGNDVWHSSWGIAQFGRLCLDPLDPSNRTIFFTTGTSQDIIAGSFTSFATVKVWEANPTLGGSPLNPPVNYGVRFYWGGSFSGIPLDGFPDFCLFGNENAWGLWGPQAIVCDGTYLYVFWCYFPDGDSGASADADGASPLTGSWLQWVVSRFTISRTTAAPGSLAAFQSRHKLTPV